MQTAPAQQSRRFLRLPGVLARVPFSRSRLYELVSERRFPAPYKLSTRVSAWDEAELNAWIEARIAERRALP